MPERYTSPALRTLPSRQLHVLPLVGVEAQIYNSLWRSILEGKLKPGVKLREEAIGEVFGVSRTVIRRVLTIMEQEGSVSLPANRGAWVASPMPEDIPVVFETLAMTLTYVIRALASPSNTIGKAHRDLLEQHLKAQAAADEARDLIRSQLLGCDFLILLAAIHGNPVITDLVAKMLMRQALIITVYRDYLLPPERAAFQRAMIDAILEHRAEDAVASFKARYDEIYHSLTVDAPDDEVDLAAVLRKASAAA
jgi:DNA-binding GntR family transcriptional regulator